MSDEKQTLPAGLEKLKRAGNLGGARPNSGRKFKPEGTGRVHTVFAKLNLYEIAAIETAKREMERALGLRKPMPDAAFIRERLILGGPPLVVSIPEAIRSQIANEDNPEPPPASANARRPNEIPPTAPATQQPTPNPRLRRARPIEAIAPIATAVSV